jgi:hypothetical protein
MTLPCYSRPAAGVRIVMRRMWCLALGVACGGSSPHGTDNHAATQPRTTYVIAVSEQQTSGVATVTVELPSGWTERYDDKRGSPALIAGADGVLAVIDVMDIVRDHVLAYYFTDGAVTQNVSDTPCG